MSGKGYGFATRSVHVGNEIDRHSGAIRSPITMANSYALPYDPSELNWSSAEGSIYTRNGGANQRQLQEKLASLEGGEDCVVLASGMAAISGTFFTFLKAGDHVVFGDNTYIGAYRLLNELLPQKYGVETTMVDSSDLEALKAAMRPNTRLVHIETPGNPTLKITDIRAVVKIAHGAGALISLDNTFASPFLTRPPELGVDLTIESLTKYVNGHGDAMGGAVIGKKALIDRIRADAMVNQGGTISPFNAWLISRGAATFPLRMRQHCDSALKMAEFLVRQPSVRFVAYPGLESHPGHSIAKSQMGGGFGGVLSFGLHADHDAHNRFVSNLKLIISAVSLGHDESLIAFLGEDDERMHLFPKEFKGGFFRMSVGIEDAEDVIDDVRQALERTGLPTDGPR
ncbi:MAG: PLP-dependent aspartate aminotransferase family protein [Candidatus Methanoplasma sp.]|jgi:methionine-gamma-lyase|nr:PLP-dependent aspartate aminotransferase family protein [Candidatus Methanoplasma sp.]